MGASNEKSEESLQLSDLFRLADEQAWKVAGTTAPNPAVGCILLNEHREIIGRGATQPAGGAHAEVMALRDAAQAGHSVKGARAIVTLEPCNHTGRTGPCAMALADAGIVRVDYLFADLSPLAQGGGDYLRERGVDVTGPHLAFGPSADGQQDAVADADAVDADAPGTQWQSVFAVEAWLTSATQSRPHVTLKLAATIDGFVAATDGTSQWITGEIARQHVHQDRKTRDAIIVGTGTVVADDPRLTARQPDGPPFAQQPLRIIMGQRDIADSAPIFQPPGEAIHLHDRDPHAVLQDLHQRGVVDVLVEGGPHISSAFLSAGLVDRIQLYQAPSVLLAGRPALHPSPELSTSMTDIREFTPRSIETLGRDILLTLSR
ncbi:dihydrofolate reductase family protein [uncultured Corynebacterium sp.]|uniref:dihydrofolate reductase family protein n=1 Tax=uncultured Corynebacterium sp. TaxID=159447 RepID=UPI0025922141|nr:dihydrofolate reductase family protein [uncultured Corynebacterium sp.]